MVKLIFKIKKERLRTLLQVKFIFLTLQTRVSKRTVTCTQSDATERKFVQILHQMHSEFFL